MLRKPSGFALVVLYWLFAFQTPALRADDPNTPVARVDGEVITAEEMEKPIGATIAELRERIHQLQQQRLDALIAERLLGKEAAKRGVSVTALLDAEVTAKVGLVTEQEVEAFYQANKARIKSDDPQIRERIRAYLQNQKLTERRNAFVDTLRSRANVVISLKPPAVFRAEIDIKGSPVKGKATAPVTIVKFEDFECPFCKDSQKTIEAVLQRYPDKVRVVHKDYPIEDIHPGISKAHEAARCANEQGKFWAYHDKLYANISKKSPADLKKFGTEVGLQMASFEKCLASKKYEAAVQKDVAEGKQVGVSGTPAFFINGRLVAGAQPLERFVRVIEDELAR